MGPDEIDTARQKWWALFGFLASAGLVATVGGLITVDRIPSWYANLDKPSWVPPDEIFGPVWTVLYVMMAVAVWLVWQQRDRVRVGAAIGWWFGQLTLNLGWTVLFFGLRSPAAGSIEIVLLWLAIVGTTTLFFRISRAAGWMMVPYLGWVSFASVLSFSVWMLNA